MKYILCDVDGVLVNGYHVDPAKRISWSENLERDFGIPSSRMESVFFHGPFGQVMEGKIGLVEALESVMPQLGYAGDAQTLIDYWFKNDSNINAPFLEWVKSKDSQNYQFSLATNQEHMRADYLWSDLGMNHHFDKIYYAAKIGFKKPYAEFFHYILDDLKIESSSICLIDDCPKNIAMAHSLGIKGVVFNSMEDVLNHPFLNEI